MVTDSKTVQYKKQIVLIIQRDEINYNKKEMKNKQIKRKIQSIKDTIPAVHTYEISSTFSDPMSGPFFNILFINLFFGDINIALLAKLLMERRLNV